MARKRSRIRTTNVIVGARFHHYRYQPMLPTFPTIRPLDLTPFEDRRLATLQHPPRVNWPKAIRYRGASPAQLQEVRRGPNLVIAFQAPKQVTLCVRRRRRREVLFAIRKTRVGVNSPKHRNQWSKVKC